MPEGPSIILFAEELQRFAGKKITAASGNAGIDMARLKGKKIIAIKTWGKHLLLCFQGFTIRIHFLLFGKYFINQRKEAVPRLALKFGRSELNFYTTAVKLIEEPLDEVYDWSADVMNESWDAKAARKKLKAMPATLVADALLDQTIFSGVGNIIKNEVLFRIKMHPESKIGALPPKKLTELINTAADYSSDFLKWKRDFVLTKHWQAHKKKICPRDETALQKKYVGKTKRRSFFCPTCQKKYA